MYQDLVVAELTPGTTFMLDYSNRVYFRTETGVVDSEGNHHAADDTYNNVKLLFVPN